MSKCVLLLIAVLMVSFATPSRAETSADDTLEFVMGDNEEKAELAKIWIDGMVTGLSWANVVLKSQGRSRLYCPPPDLALTNEQQIDILRRGVADEPGWGTYPVGLIMLQALQLAYPCQ